MSNPIADIVMRNIIQKMARTGPPLSQEFEMLEEQAPFERMERYPPSGFTSGDILRQDILQNLANQGFDVAGEEVPFGSEHRIRVTPEGWKPKGQFPLAGLEDVGGKFAVTSQIAKNPVIMEILNRYIKMGKPPYSSFREMDISSPNPYEGLGFDISPSSSTEAGGGRWK